MKTITILRREPIPALFAQLPWIRAPLAPTLYADVPEDRKVVAALQRVIRCEVCLSSLESSSWFIKAEFPENLASLKGKTGAVVEWRVWFWKPDDVRTLFGGRLLPTEACLLEDAGIEPGYLVGLASPVSCLPRLDRYFEENGEEPVPAAERNRIIAEETRLGVP